MPGRRARPKSERWKISWPAVLRRPVIAPIRDLYLRNQRENRIAKELSRLPGSINRARVGLDYPTEVWRSNRLPVPGAGRDSERSLEARPTGKGRVSSALDDEQIPGAVGEPDLHQAGVELRRLAVPLDLRAIRGWGV